MPLDFFSWHHYHQAPSNPFDLVRLGRQVRRLLDQNGFKQAENHVTEWGLSRANPDRANPDSAIGAAFAGAVLINLQDSVVDLALCYRGDATSQGFFDRAGDYRRKAYAFKAAGAMLDTPQRLAATGADGTDLAVLAGRSEDGNKIQVLVCNLRCQPDYQLTVGNLPWGQGPFRVKHYRLSNTDRFEPPVESSGQDGKLEIASKSAAPAVEWFVLQP